MFRLWGKLYTNRKLVNDYVVEDNSDLNRTRKVFRGLEEICNQFDLGNPIWLDSNIKDFKISSKTRFYADSFIESISFDYLEIQVIEEDN